MTEIPKPTEYVPLPLPDRAGLPDDEMRARAAAFRQHMAKRHSVRMFDPRPVPTEIIRDCIAAAGLSPSGANRQPWHFAAISDPVLKAQIRAGAEAEEGRFYDGGAPDEWLAALEPIGTGVSKPHLQDAPWLIVVFAQRYGLAPDGQKIKHYYVPDSVGIACGVLITALHNAGLTSLVHTPSPMSFLRDLCGRPAHEKPMMILAIGHPAADATVPQVAKIKKSMDNISTFFEGENS